MLKRIIKFFTPKCNHRFTLKDVVIWDSDPLCVFCNKPLSELKNQVKN